ncbi:esterase/lipase family protein [Rhodococcus jostii]|uniref:esterase/lipase family protein n=1 Tax=Rhodococcus jostii TaxID=132919 RepID=UPI00365BE393
MESPAGWVFYASNHNGPVSRLVVFVHGFMGKAVTTWSNFEVGAGHRDWWREADLLFVGYRSTKETITGVANRLRREIPEFYPTPFPAAMNVGGHPVRKDAGSPYSELVVIGHSLGGLIVRRALCDAAMEWDKAGRTDPKPALLTAQIRLFSPASAGFRAAGFLGILRATSLWRAINMVLSRAPAYTDLQPDSSVLRNTQERTERLACQIGFESLAAKIIWANPDTVVISERYTTDHVDGTWDETTHTSVCKPERDAFEKPWIFAETGDPR